MSALRKADQRVLGWSLAAWALVSVIGLIWAFPQVEDSLDESSQEIESFTSVKGAELEWNGRDGYLTLPAGTPNAKQIEADLANQSGPRDVQTVFADGGDPPAAEPDADPALVPAVFNISWDEAGNAGDGSVPSGSEDHFNSLFATGNDLSGDETVTMSDGTRSILTDRLAPLIGTELASGRITVNGDDITITGVAPDQETLDRIAGDLESVEGLTVDLIGPEASPAKFNVAWDPTGSTQTGDAPDGLSGGVGGLGIADPLLASGLTVGPDVEPAMVALAPLIGNELEAGQISVDDNSVTITGTATDQEALDRALAALGETGATIELSLSNAGQAQGELDELLALDKIEFLTNTAIPTDATEGIIDSVADVLNRFESIEVEITGHTDDRGSDALNQALSETRAEAVRQGLIERGIDEARLSASGKGETDPIDTNETSEGRQRNRRVEIIAKESN